MGCMHLLVSEEEQLKQTTPLVVVAHRSCLFDWHGKVFSAPLNLTSLIATAAAMTSVTL